MRPERAEWVRNPFLQREPEGAGEALWEMCAPERCLREQINFFGLGCQARISAPSWSGRELFEHHSYLMHECEEQKINNLQFKTGTIRHYSFTLSVITAYEGKHQSRSKFGYFWTKFQSVRNRSTDIFQAWFRSVSVRFFFRENDITIRYHVVQVPVINWILDQEQKSLIPIIWPYSALPC